MFKLRVNAVNMLYDNLKKYLTFIIISKLQYEFEIKLEKFKLLVIVLVLIKVSVLTILIKTIIMHTVLSVILFKWGAFFGYNK